MPIFTKTKSASASEASTRNSDALQQEGCGGSRSDFIDEHEVTPKIIVMGQSAELVVAAATAATPNEKVSIGLSPSSVGLGPSASEAIQDKSLMFLGQSVQLVSHLSRLPVCENRDEALSTTVLYLMHVNPSVGSNSVHKQLGRLGSILNELSHQRRHLRPATAVLLVRTPNSKGKLAQQKTSPEAEESWRTELEELELVHGGICKFGPVSLNDAAAIDSVIESLVFSAQTRLCSGSTSLASSFLAPHTYQAEREDSREDFEADVHDSCSKPEAPIRRIISL